MQLPIGKKELKKLILSSSPLDFCRYHMFDQNVHLFQDHSGLGIRGSYHEFKCEIANSLHTSPNNIAIVGSGKFGFSMNPTKPELLKEFHKRSDIDVVIACPKTFEDIWNNLRRSYYSNQTEVIRGHRLPKFVWYRCN